MYFSLAGAAMGDSELEKMAAVAEFGSHDQMSGGAEDRERSERQQHGVKPSDDGRASDAGIAEYLRDVYRRKRHTRQGVAHRPAAAERPKAREEA